MKRFISVVTSLFFLLTAINAQEKKKLWHGIERELRYRPEGNDIVIENGTIIKGRFINNSDLINNEKHKYKK